MSDETENEREYKAFAKRLDDSSFGVFIVAAWFHKNKRTVRIPPTHIRPFHEKAEKHADNGDLFVEDKDGVESLIEVKHLSRNFTSLEDWPFKDMIVSNAGSVERRRGQVKSYIMLSKDANHIAILMCDTMDQWWKEKRFAHNTQREEHYYVCDPALCKFISIEGKK